MIRKNGYLIALLLLLVLVISACTTVARPQGSSVQTPASTVPSAASDEEGALVIYSGRSEGLVAPVIEMFSEATGIATEVRYGSTAEIASTILEEGANSPADVFFGQDAGALGALAQEGRLVVLPDSILDQVDPIYRSPAGEWVGVTARARVIAYDSTRYSEEDLPTTLDEINDPAWAGRVGYAPTNASFQAFVTALRVLEGEDAARTWLEALIANDAVPYSGNTQIVEAVANGEIDLGLVNHYYLYQFLAEQGDDFPVRNYHLPEEGAGSIVNIAGGGILDSASHPVAAEAFLNFLLSHEAQEYFAMETNEYPLSASVEMNPLLKPIDEIAVPDLDLSDLADLQGTLELLQDVGALQ